MPAQRACDGLGVGIENHLTGIKAMSGGGVIRAVDAVSIDLSERQARHEAVPDLISHFWKRDPAGFCQRVGCIEEAEVHAGRMLRKERKIDSLRGQGGAQWSGSTWPDSRRRVHGAGEAEWRRIGKGTGWGRGSLTRSRA